ncbi:unnamed protein product [Adineta ricciae]|uniref:Cytochrome P450 n=1 Tax=Adineta ricciae TaxID=249248 RepID=A0A815B0U6_ADIRI|nr:unnamed protein product [Adineta ricciae]CAF1264367.1 unnamed protein product [Adineta ricciae]
MLHIWESVPHTESVPTIPEFTQSDSAIDAHNSVEFRNSLNLYLSGIKPQWLISNLKNTGVSTGEVTLHEVLAKLKETFGDAFLFWLGPYPSIILSRIEYVQHVLTDRHTYDQATSTASSFGTLFPSGLITLRGETWKRHARFILPMFKRAKILPYFNKKIVNCIDRLVDEQFVKHDGEIHRVLVVQYQNVLLNVIAFDYSYFFVICRKTIRYQCKSRRRQIK